MSECPICFLEINALVDCATTSCGHKFHTSCLVKCVVSSSRFACPYCRGDMSNNETSVIAPVRAPEIVEDSQPLVVKKIRLNEITYLICKRTNKLFDYNEYIRNEMIVEVGRWNKTIHQVELS